jgi:hypothetical protein
MPAKPTIPDNIIADTMRALKSPVKVAKELNVTERWVYRRLARIEADTGENFKVEGKTTHKRAQYQPEYDSLELTVKDSVMVMYSDAHFWPGLDSCANRALLKLLPEIRPNWVWDLGDSLDAASVSRHPPNGWTDMPKLAVELEAMLMAKRKIKEVSKGASHAMIHSNHAARFDKYFAMNASEAKGIRGTRLRDHVEEPIYLRVIINGHTLLIHGMRYGIHAQYNNVQMAHISTISGHLHAQQVRPRTTLSKVNGGTNTIYGVDVGTLASVDGPQFDYRLGTPSDWRSGFAVITFKDGILMPPEFCTVVDEDKELVFFRGKVVTL